MSRTFQDSLEYDGENVFANANEFGTSLTHTSPVDGSETVTGVVDFDSLDQGTPPTHDDAGNRIVQRAILELPLSVRVVEYRGGSHYPSTFTIDGQVWLAHRLVGKDSATQSFEIRRVDMKSTKGLR